MQKFQVSFDDGFSVLAEVRSRDLVKLEAQGVDLTEIPPMRGSYLLAHAALLRLTRTGVVPEGRVPATVEELMDVADIEPEEDAEGNGSGQAAPTG